MKKIFIHNIIFRVIAPLFYGILVYVLILLVFDSVESLNQNFINEEVLFCIGLTYLMMEILRVQIIILDKLLPFNSFKSIRLIVQIIASMLLAIIVASSAVTIYFQYILSFSKFTTELLTFNVIFVISTGLFNMIYISLAYLNMENNAKLEEEKIKRKNLEYQMRAFNNEVNPSFLYASLETLIGILYQNEEDSEQYIENLSTVYRYILSNKNNELVSLKTEIESSKALLNVLNVKYDNQISLSCNLDEQKSNLLLVPGTVNMLIEKIVGMTIISNRQPMKIKCYLEDDYLVFQVKSNDRLVQNDRYVTENLTKPYEYFTIRPVIELKAYGDMFVKIPLLDLISNEEQISA
jgi:two-component system LytT family sensor kinase